MRDRENSRDDDPLADISQHAEIKEPWWIFGLGGSITLSLFAIFIFLIWLFRSGENAFATTEFREILSLAGFLLASGFVAGVAVWWSYYSTRMWGKLSDAICGIVVVDTFIICCMAYFEPEMLTTRSEQGLLMIKFGSFIGLVAGLLFGADSRKK